MILAASGDATCPVSALQKLFVLDPRLPNAPLFRLSSSPFSFHNVVSILKKRLNLVGLSDTGYSGHSFRKEAAQHAADNGMLDESRKRLGRWTSDAVKSYFRTRSDALFNLNLSFQKGVPLDVPRAGRDESDHTPTHNRQQHQPHTVWARSFGQHSQPGRAGVAPSPGYAHAPPRERPRSSIPKESPSSDSIHPDHL